MQPLQTTQPIRYQFDVKILENEGEELAKLLPQLDKHYEDAGKYMRSTQQSDPSFSQEASRKLYGIFFTSLMEVTKIQKVVRDRIVDIHYKIGLSDKYKIVVAYDSVNKLPQAFGLVVLKRGEIKSRNSIELFSLITSIWNLNSPQNNDHPNQVKGAGSAIIDCCKKLGVEHQAKYLYLTAAPSALSFYEKHGFKRLNPESVDNNLGDDLIGIKRTPMYFDLEMGNQETT